MLRRISGLAVGPPQRRQQKNTPARGMFFCWCCRSGLAAGAKLVAAAPRRTPPARSCGMLCRISGLTVEPPQRRQQKNTPARGMFFCWCCRSGLAAGAKLVAAAPRRTLPARSCGMLCRISGLTVGPPQRRQQKNTPARGMFFCWCRWSGLAAGAKLVAAAPRRTPPARSCGMLCRISGLTVEPPQRRQQKNTPARGMFFCWCRWSDSNRHGIATTGF